MNDCEEYAIVIRFNEHVTLSEKMTFLNTIGALITEHMRPGPQKEIVELYVDDKYGDPIQ